MALTTPITYGVREPGPSPFSFNITPSDTVPISPAIRGFYVGGTGDVVGTNSSGATVTFTAIPAGKIMPASLTLIKSTGTTATFIVGFA